MEGKGEKVIDLGLCRAQGPTTETFDQWHPRKNPIELDLRCTYVRTVCSIRSRRRLMAQNKRAILIKRVTHMFRSHLPLSGSCQVGRGNIHDKIVHGSFRKAKLSRSAVAESQHRTTATGTADHLLPKQFRSFIELCCNRVKNK